MNPGDKAESAQQQQKGPETFLTNEERRNLQRTLGFPEDLPPKFKSWVQEYLSVNFPQIPITQVSGFEKYLYKKGTELPENPRDGQRFTYLADAANGISWEFRYNDASGSQYKWEFAGGPPISVEASAEVSTTATGFGDLGGPGSTLPLPGDYLIAYGCAYDQSTDDADVQASIYNGSTSGNIPIEGEGIWYGGAGHRAFANRSGIVNLPTAGNTMTVYYRVGSGTGYFRNRWILITPVRVKRA